jgi:prevent-host-death family protein
MPKTMSATEARVHFGEVIRSVNASGDHIVVEKDGKRAAIILSPRRFDELMRRSSAEDILERVREGHLMIEKAFAGKPIPDAYDLINGGRDDVDDIESVL